MENLSTVSNVKIFPVIVGKFLEDKRQSECDIKIQDNKNGEKRVAKKCIMYSAIVTGLFSFVVVGIVLAVNYLKWSFV